MLDPLTALGLTGNLIQIIAFSADLVTEGNRIYRDADGASNQYSVIEEVTKDLEALATGLKTAQDSWQAGSSNDRLNPDHVLLQNLCDRCTDIAVELQMRLSKLKAKEGKGRRLRSYRQALLTVWRKDAIEDLAGRLEQYRREVDTRLLFGLRKGLEQADMRHTAQYKSLDQQSKDILEAVSDGGTLDVKFSAQTEMLHQIASGQHETNRMLLTVVSSAGKMPSREPSPSGIDVSTGLSRSTPMHEAAKTGAKSDLLKVLRDASIDVNAKDEYGRTPLHVAATAEVAKLLLRDEHFKCHAKDNEGRSALHIAVLDCRLSVLKLLLEAGLDKEWPDDCGELPADYALDCPAAVFMLRYGHETEALIPDGLDRAGLCHMA